MSKHEARRQHRQDRHLCASCRERKAKYQYHGHVRAERQHVLCFQCFRSARERMRARQLVLGATSTPASLGARPLGAAPVDALPVGAPPFSASARLGLSAPSASLSPSRIQHRQQMLAFLESQQAQKCAQR